MNQGRQEQLVPSARKEKKREREVHQVQAGFSTATAVGPSRPVEKEKGKGDESRLGKCSMPD